MPDAFARLRAKLRLPSPINNVFPCCICEMKNDVFLADGATGDKIFNSEGPLKTLFMVLWQPCFLQPQGSCAGCLAAKALPPRIIVQRVYGLALAFGGNTHSQHINGLFLGTGASLQLREKVLMPRYCVVIVKLWIPVFRQLKEAHVFLELFKILISQMLCATGKFSSIAAVRIS